MIAVPQNQGPDATICYWELTAIVTEEKGVRAPLDLCIDDPWLASSLLIPLGFAACSLHAIIAWPGSENAMAGPFGDWDFNREPIRYKTYKKGDLMRIQLWSLCPFDERLSGARVIYQLAIFCRGSTRPLTAVLRRSAPAGAMDADDVLGDSAAVKWTLGPKF